MNNTAAQPATESQLAAWANVRIAWEVSSQTVANRHVTPELIELEKVAKATT